MDSYVGPTAGTEKQLLHLIANLDPNRFKPHLGVLRSSNYITTNTFPCDITVLGINKIICFDTIKRLFQLTNFIKCNHISLVHILFNDASIIAPIFCKIAGARVIVSRRDMGFWYTTKALSALKISNLFVDCFVVNSRAVRDNVSIKERIADERITLITNGFDVAEIKREPATGFREIYDIGPFDPIVGIVANFSPLKRHADLLKAFLIVLHTFNNAHLVLVGRGHQEAILKEMTRSLNIQDRVHFAGYINNVISVIKHFTLCVLCSESEGLSNALIEYMACRKAIICTNVGGNLELIKHDYNGLLTRVGDINNLAENIIKILSDPILARTLGYNAQTTIYDNFNNKNMVNLYMRLYERLVFGESN